VQYFCGELSFDLIYELKRWKFLSAANKFCDRFSCLCKLQSHTVSELKIKFGDTDSVGRMKQHVHIYSGHPVRIMCSFELFVYLHPYSLVLSVRLFGTVGFFFFLLFLLVFHSVFVFAFVLCSA